LKADHFCSFSENDTPANYFGRQLLAAGYNYHGNEPMYSGITGQEFKADIYLGLVYYQRLRHMVNDKFQVRTEGPVDQLTRQPIKGRKRGGGVRFGEMERDALLAHGTSFLLQDRLLNCSDWSTAWVCRDCGSMISLGYDEVGLGSQVFGIGPGQENDPTLDSGPGGEYCRLCRATDEAGRKLERTGEVLSLKEQVQVLQRKGRMALVVIPFVFRYLLAELAAMGVKLSLKVD
jgi:DNA-directed RNA polymerase I subunit RPA2